jgi:hypothetical protein
LTVEHGRGMESIAIEKVFFNDELLPLPPMERIIGDVIINKKLSENVPKQRFF